jgi:hypothetical protein
LRLLENSTAEIKLPSRRDGNRFLEEFHGPHSYLNTNSTEYILFVRSASASNPAADADENTSVVACTLERADAAISNIRHVRNSAVYQAPIVPHPQNTQKPLKNGQPAVKRRKPGTLTGFECMWVILFRTVTVATETPKVKKLKCIGMVKALFSESA